jgi:NhaA family Na+:H+ antiporter
MKGQNFVKNFIHNETSGGVVMIFFALVAIIVANSGFSGAYKSFINFPIAVDISSFSADFTLKTFVKDVFMCIFFLLVGMELKREMVEGHLSKKGQKILPLIAALGGILTPALFFFIFNINHPENHAGWAISSATDIAFALCVLTLIGKSVPASAKIFLLAIAIYDDLAAIIIIALFYSSGIEILPILCASLVTFIIFLLNRNNFDKILVYLILGCILWVCFYLSGIHTTVAGVILGVLIPIKIENKNISPLKNLIKTLHPFSAFFILPLFAFVSAGVSFENITIEALLAPLTLGIALSLFIGKQVGIFTVTYLAVKAKIASKPEGTSWMDIYGVSIIAGIGFTMSLFIGLLAFKDPLLQDEVKIGVIAGSILSTIWGFIVFKFFCKKR